MTFQRNHHSHRTTVLTGIAELSDIPVILGHIVILGYSGISG